MLPGLLSIPPPWLDPLFFLTSLAWALIRSFITFIICLFLGIAAVKVLDVMTPGIRELEDIKRHPVPTGLFSAGFFIFVSLTIMGSVIAPLPIGFQSGIGQAVNPLLVFSMRLLTLLAGFAVSILLTFILTRVIFLNWKPFGIDLHDIEKDPVGIGIYVMGFLIFLGIILCACLLLPA